MNSPLLQVQNLHKSYGAQNVLRGLSFEVKQGEVLAVIGGSGSGKTTLLRCLGLLTLPNEGQIDLDGQRFQTDQSPPYGTWHTKIGMVFQQFHLWPHKTVLENLLLAPLKLRSDSPEILKEEAQKWLLRIGLANKAQSFPPSLSGGEQQRVALVRALMTRPKILLLDEITSALDPELKYEVKELVRDLIKNEQLSCLLVTHDLSFVREIADRVFVLHEGRIIERGTPEQILDHPTHPETKIFLKRVNNAT